VTLATGTKLGPYEILSPIGAGGMGEVYRAKDPRLGREVAIKVLPASLANDAERLRRFEQEARSASALNHPNIVTIHEIGSFDSTPYLAMELIEGMSLRELLASGSLPTKRLLDAAVQIAEGLSKAHSAGIVHRDLKPENVMVTKDGYVKLLDFGLAKLFAAPQEQITGVPTAIQQETQPGTVMGTVGYMSPEQASGRPADFRSDQFALGSILYEMATGKRAFQRGTGAQTLAAIIQEEPEPIAQVNPRAPAPLRWIVERCLAKDPDERYASTRDLARDLKSVREHIGEVTSTASGAAPVAEPARKRRSLGIPLAIAAVVLAAAAGLLAGRRTAVVAQPKFQRLTFQRGTVVAARFGPDGHTVYYSAAWEGGKSRVFLLRPGNPESSALALPPANLLGISGGGEIAVQLDPKPAPQGFGFIGTLARAPLSGGAPKEILQDVTYAEWLPGGADLAVVQRVAGKDRLEYPIGKVLFETAGWIQGPRFSADGALIAFIHHPAAGDGGAIVIVDRAGKSRELAAGWATVQGLAWAPNGEIWFTAVREGIQREIYSVTTGGRLRLVRTMQGTPALLDMVGSSALVTEDDYRAGLLAFLPDQSSTPDLGWFDWSNDRGLSDDGKLVLLDESGEGGGPKASVYLRPTDGSPALRVSDGLGISLSRDGAWAMTRTSDEPARFVMVPVKAGQQRELPTDPYGLTPYGAFFPDGSRFAFVGASPGHGSRIYVQSVSGGAATPISAEGVNPGRISVSPDGRFVAATGPDQSLHLYPTAGGAPIDLTNSRSGDAPGGFTADGKGLYVSRPGNPCPLELLDIASGRRAHVRDLAGLDAAGVVAVGPARVTPDGKTIIAGYGRILSTLYRVSDLR
jgi:eukaryotic-like serine/threonine-protein kinase